MQSGYVGKEYPWGSLPSFATYLEAARVRDLLTVLIFSAGAVMALRRPYFGALVWVWIGLMNPHRLGWGFAYDLPLAQISVFVTLAGILLNSKQVRLVGGGGLYALVALVLWMGVTTIAAILVDPSLNQYIAVLKVIFMTFVTLAVVRTQGEIIGLVWTIALSIGFFGVKGGLFTILSGGSHRVWGPPESVVEGNNEIAVALVIVVPLLFFLTQHLGIARARFLTSENRTRVLKYGLIAMMILCAFAALGSQSRGALLAIGAMVSVLWWRSTKKLAIGVVLMLLVPIVLAFLPESWYARMETIGSYDEDASALGRINAWTMAFNIAKDRITGAGFATAAEVIYTQYAPSPNYVLVAHSIYFQILGEHGFIGLSLYLLMWATAYTAAGRIRALAAVRGAELEWVVSLASMLQVSMVGFAVGGAFLSIAYWDLPYYLIVLVYALRAHIAQELATDRQQVLSERAALQR